MSKKQFVYKIDAKRGSTNINKLWPVMAETASEAMKSVRKAFKDNPAYKDFIIKSITNMTKK